MRCSPVCAAKPAGQWLKAPTSPPCRSGWPPSAAAQSAWPGPAGCCQLCFPGRPG
uniref:Alternative protein n=1 Tax=Macrostomum lignano TaxID=282301 RepID=A0A1I8I6S9_9PLAT